MAVNLSPVAGAAAQFFDNSGNVLTGGKIYTYLAGTTTPAVTYTSSSGVTAHPNPIILNAAGRVPDSGEIWLTDSISYKFVLKDQNDVLIATYDNIVGINSNFVNFTGEEETQTATQGQTVFTLTTLQYQPATNNLLVFVNGSKQIITDNYVETSSTVVTFVDGLNVGDVVDFCTATPINTFSATAASVSYNEGQTGAIDSNIQTRLREFLSGGDFGVVADGTTDDTIAMQDAINASIATGIRLMLPPGNIKVTSPLTIGLPCQIQGQGRDETVLVADGDFDAVLHLNGGNAGTSIDVSDLQIDTQGNDTRCVLIDAQTASLWPLTFSNCQFYGDRTGGLVDTSGILSTFLNCEFFANNANSVAINFIDNNQNSTVDTCLFSGFGKGIVVSTAGGVNCEGIRIVNSVFACPKTSVTLGGACGYTKLIGNIFDQVLNNYVVFVTENSYLTQMTNNYFGGATGNTSALLVLDPGTYGHTITGNTFQQGSTGILAQAFSGAHVSYLTIDGNTFLGCTTTTIQLDSVVPATIVNNTDIGSPTNGSYATIATDIPGTYTFDNNHWSSNALLNFDGTATYYWGNDLGVYGRRVVKTVGTLSGTTVTITHGLITTPSKVIFSINPGATNPGASWVTGVTSTQFTVAWENPAIVTVYWEAQV